MTAFILLCMRSDIIIVGHVNLFVTCLLTYQDTHVIGVIERKAVFLKPVSIFTAFDHR